MSGVAWREFPLTRGGKGLLVESQWIFAYKYSTEKTGRQYVRCQLHAKGCKATGVIVDGILRLNNSEHTHESPNWKTLELQQKCNQAAKDPNNFGTVSYFTI